MTDAPQAVASPLGRDAEVGVHRTLEVSLAHCRQITRERARNFYYGMKLTPEPKRSVMYAVYAWMRQADDLADDNSHEAQRQRRLAQFRHDTHRVFDHPDASLEELPSGVMWPAVHLAVHAFGIPRAYFDAMLDGQEMDQHVTRYRALPQLEDYCYKVASVVGLTCLCVWGHDGSEAARVKAIQRGKAFQITNILRDIREDARRDRVYLPSELMGFTELSPRVILSDSPPLPLVRGVRRLALRAEVLYRRSDDLESHLHRDGVACSAAMRDIYRALLRQMLRDPMRVFQQRRVTVGPMSKAIIAQRAWVRGLFASTPSAAAR